MHKNLSQVRPVMLEKPFLLKQTDKQTTPNKTKKQKTHKTKTNKKNPKLWAPEIRWRVFVSLKTGFNMSFMSSPVF